jgi:hypothetical protein
MWCCLDPQGSGNVLAVSRSRSVFVVQTRTGTSSFDPTEYYSTTNFFFKLARAWIYSDLPEISA